jgi:hypothetical protein
MLASYEYCLPLEWAECELEALGAVLTTTAKAVAEPAAADDPIMN